jgi:predicted hydrocarbon binding protein
MGSPQVPIDVDPDTGIWRTDGLPMVYLPRHFLVNNHVAVEEALGRDTYRTILRAATEKSAIHWCEAESKTHGLAPEATFRHYLKRLSQRGWGQFSVARLDVSGDRGGTISVQNSVFALEQRGRGQAPLCYMFEGFISGAFTFVLRSTRPDQGTIAVSCRESSCAGDGVHPHCTFEFQA